MHNPTTTPQANNTPAQATPQVPANTPQAPTPAPANTPAQVPAWARHNNPQVAKVLAAVAKVPGTPQAQVAAAMAKYGSAAALCRALGCNGKPNQRAVRQVLRDAGMGVGRGNTYSGNVGAKVATAAKRNAKAQAQAAKQAAKGAQG